MNSKNLHKHALPILFIAVAAFVGTVGFVSSLPRTDSISSSEIAHALTTSLVSITRSNHGLADVRLRTLDTPKPTSTGLPDLNAAESSAALQLRLQQSN
jgi:hypothetical protein